MYSKLGRGPLQHEFYPIGIQFNFRRVPSEIHTLRHTFYGLYGGVTVLYTYISYIISRNNVWVAWFQSSTSSICIHIGGFYLHFFSKSDYASVVATFTWFYGKQLMKGQKTVSQCILGKKCGREECLTYIFFHEIDRSVSIGHSISNQLHHIERRAALKARAKYWRSKMIYYTRQ